MTEHEKVSVWMGFIDFFQSLLVFVLVVMVVACTAVLIFFDALAGTGVMLGLTNNNLQASVTISLATSGLLFALMMVGYSMVSSKYNIVANVGIVMLLVAVGFFCVDVYFDSLTADWLRFRKIVRLSSLPEGDIHGLFRTLIGGISVVGEAMAVAIIFGMPILKEIVDKALPKEKKPKLPSKTVPNRPNRYPPTRPVQNDIMKLLEKNRKKATPKSASFNSFRLDTEIYNKLPKDR